MKHVVELKYTNPAHEHVSLRRRVETINRVVEAQSADEALNRAANQQRSLGFRIQSANIVEQKEELSEAVDYKALEKPTYLRIKSGETKPVDRTDYNKPTFLRKKEKEEKPKSEEVEQTDEGVMDALKKAQVKWKTAHRAVYGKDPSAKSMAIGAVARLVGAKPHTARSVSTQIAGKPVTAQQQAAAKARAGKMGMARMRSEEKETAEKNDVNSNVKGKVAANKMSQKAAEIRKSKIEGSVNQINLEPSLDLHRPATLDPNKRIQK